MRAATGRWNRDLPHVGENVSDGRAVWFQCSCGFMGELRTSTADADRDADGHERFVFEQRRAGRRLVRGRVE